MTRLLAVRRTVQAGFAALMAAVAFVPWRFASGEPVLTGNFLSFHIALGPAGAEGPGPGLTLADPLAVAQTYASSGGVASPGLTGALIALGIAFCLGPVFCSWACPYGLFAELAQSLRSGRRPTPGGRSGFPSRAAVAVSGLLAVGLLGLPPILNQLSQPAWYSRLWQLWTLNGVLGAAILFPLTALTLEAGFGRRLWCRYACPQSVLLALARRASPVALRVRFEPKRCVCSRDGHACSSACSLGLEPRRPASLPLECNNCGDCVEVCKARGRALSFGFGRGRAA